MNKFTVWVSRSQDFADLLDPFNDVLAYHGLSWEESMSLFEVSLREGFLLCLCREEEGDNAETESGTKL